MSMTINEKPARKLTGRGVLLWLFGFFGVIFAANGAFIYYALSTFPGVEVASSYKAGQEFEAEVAAGRAQAERGWKVDAHVEPVGPDARVSIHFVDKAGADIHGLRVALQLIHAVDPAHDHQADLIETASGVYTADLSNVPTGSWEVTIEASRDGERLFKSRNQLSLAR